MSRPCPVARSNFVQIEISTNYKVKCVDNNVSVETEQNERKKNSHHTDIQILNQMPPLHPNNIFVRFLPFATRNIWSGCVLIYWNLRAVCFFLVLCTSLRYHGMQFNDAWLAMVFCPALALETYTFSWRVVYIHIYGSSKGMCCAKYIFRVLICVRKMVSGYCYIYIVVYALHVSS